MENKAMTKQGSSWPALFDTGWMDKFFNAPIDGFFNLGKVMNVPAVNVSETAKDYKLVMAVPGMEKKDFKLDCDDDLLTISAEKEIDQKEEHGRFNRREYNYNSWSRSFTLPENCNAGGIQAEYLNGELKITIPKKEVKDTKKVKNIAVN